MTIEQRGSLLKELRGRVEGFSNRVAPVYQILQWRWGSIGRIPTAEDISTNLLSKVSDLEKEGDVTSISSGGLTVKVVESDDGDYIELSFQMQETVYLPEDDDVSN